MWPGAALMFSCVFTCCFCMWVCGNLKCAFLCGFSLSFCFATGRRRRDPLCACASSCHHSAHTHCIWHRSVLLHTERGCCRWSPVTLKGRLQIDVTTLLLYSVGQICSIHSARDEMQEILKFVSSISSATSWLAVPTRGIISAKFRQGVPYLFFVRFIYYFVNSVAVGYLIYDPLFLVVSFKRVALLLALLIAWHQTLPCNEVLELLFTATVFNSNRYLQRICYFLS